MATFKFSYVNAGDDVTYTLDFNLGLQTVAEAVDYIENTAGHTVKGGNTPPTTTLAIADRKPVTDDLLAGEMIRFNLVTGDYEGSRNIDTDTKTDFKGKQVEVSEIVPESGSIKMPGLVLSDLGGYLGNRSNVTGRDFITMDYLVDATGTKTPTYDSRGIKQVRVVEQSDDTQTMLNVTNYAVNPSISQDVLKLYLKLINPLTNFRARVISDTTSEVIKYFPSRNDWNEGTGVNVGSGEQSFDVTPDFAQVTGFPITVELMADQDVDLLGDGVTPWRAVDRQVITLKRISVPLEPIEVSVIDFTIDENNYLDYLERTILLTSGDVGAQVLRFGTIANFPTGEQIQFNVVNARGGSDVIDIVPAGGNTIRGEAFLRFRNNAVACIELPSSGTDWRVLGCTEVDYDIIKYNPISAPTYAEGNTYYDITDKSLSYQTDESDVTLNIGKEMFLPPKCTNNEGATIVNGQAVYVSGSDGLFPRVKLAKADTEATARAVGLVTQSSVLNNADCYVTHYGLVRDVNTAAYTNGDILYLSPTTFGGLTNVKPTHPDKARRIGFVISAHATQGIIMVLDPSFEDAEGSVSVSRSYAISDYGLANENFVAGFYEYDTTDITLTIGGTVSKTFGTPNRAVGAHAFCVASGAGSAGLTLTVSGNSIDDFGNRTVADSEVVVADPSTASTNQYFETTKKWLGEITYTLTGGSGSFTFNYGCAKYDDFGDKDFTVVDFEMVGKTNGTATDLNIELLKHQATGWTYAASGFVAGSDAIVSMADDYGADRDTTDETYFAYKRIGLSTAVDGSDSEGVVIRITQTTNNSIRYGTAQIGVRI